MKNLAVLMILTVLVMGCEEKVENGKIPKEYLAEAQKFVGNFSGQVLNRPIRLQIFLDQENRLIVRSFDQNDGETLLPGCSARIGLLESVAVSEKAPTVRWAKFNFKGTSCGLPTNELTLQPMGNHGLAMAIVKRMHREPSDFDCREDARGHMRCHRTPGQTVVDEWMTADFKKY